MYRSRPDAERAPITGGERFRRRRGGLEAALGGADVADGLADHCAHCGHIEGLEAAVGERGESAGESDCANRGQDRPDTCGSVGVSGP